MSPAPKSARFRAQRELTGTLYNAAFNPDVHGGAVVPELAASEWETLPEAPVPVAGG
jgi:hypothetical protein